MENEHKPLAFWGTKHRPFASSLSDCGCNYNLPLIKDISETFGNFLENMSEEDAFWLISQIAHKACLRYDTPLLPSDEAREMVSRLHELKLDQLISLIQALANS